MKVGVDIENIKRFEILQKDEFEGFLSKIFTERELDYCFSKKNPAPHLAVRFCGKEATLKALDIPHLEYNQIEIINNERDIPEVHVHSKYISGTRFHLSLSHCQDKAIGFVVVE